MGQAASCWLFCAGRDLRTTTTPALQAAGSNALAVRGGRGHAAARMPRRRMRPARPFSRRTSQRGYEGGGKAHGGGGEARAWRGKKAPPRAGRSETKRDNETEVLFFFASGLTRGPSNPPVFYNCAKKCNLEKRPAENDPTDFFKEGTGFFVMKGRVARARRQPPKWVPAQALGPPKTHKLLLLID